MIVVPTLSSAGFIPAERGIDFLFADILTADFSQSDDYVSQVTSIPAILEKAHPAQTYAVDLERALETYFQRYFKETVVNCSQQVVGESDITINIMARLTSSSGKKYDLHKIIFGSVESNSLKIIRVLNGTT